MSDFPSAYIQGLWSQTFPCRSVTFTDTLRALPVLVHRVSTLAWGLRLRQEKPALVNAVWFLSPIPPLNKAGSWKG